METPTKSANQTMLKLGALCEPVSKQLAGILPDEKLKQYDIVADAITQLMVRGYIGDSLVSRLRWRLVRQIQKAVRDLAESTLEENQRRGLCAD